MKNTTPWVAQPTSEGKQMKISHLAVIVASLLVIIGATAPLVQSNASESTMSDSFSVDKTNQTDTIVISSNELESMTQDSIKKIEEQVIGGQKLIVTGSTDVQIFSNIPSISLMSDSNAIYHDNAHRITCYYAFNGPNADDKTSEWSNTIEQRVADAVKNGESDFVMYEEGHFWDDEKFSSEITLKFYKLMTDGGLTYYVVNSYFKAFVEKVGSERAVADMSVYCDVKADNVLQDLQDSSPDSWMPPNVEGSKTMSISMGFKGFTLDFEDKEEWEISVSNAEIDNSSSTNKDIYSIMFDFNEEKFDFNNATMRTGAVVSVDNASTLELTFDYHVQFREDYNNFWPWDPGYSWYNHTISVPININPNA